MLLNGMRPTSRAAALATAFAALAATCFGAGVSASDYVADVKYLASPELKGRATGTPELEKAAAFIARQFKSFGLKPAGRNGYEQSFPVKLAATLGKVNKLSAKLGNQSRELKLSQDFAPFSFSSVGTMSSDVVFAGYGITAREWNYDDYDGIDVKGKVVLILRHEPQEGRELSDHATFTSKAVNAKMHGARGVIVVNDGAAHPEAADTFAAFGRSAGPLNSGVFFVQVKESIAAEWLKAEGRDLRALTLAISKDRKPASFPMHNLNVHMSIDIRHEEKTVHNVAAYLPGTSKEYVILGAHYDHLGLGDENSLAPALAGHTIHPGADDNASGTSGVIELARWFSKQPKPKRGILFLTFAGEELGLYGSEWYANHPILPLEDAVAMINMDMIGRMKDGKIYLNGSGTGSTFAKLIEDVKPPASIHIDLAEKTGYGSSDHTSFTTKQVPVLFFFSGLHADYHKPSDTWDKIDGPATASLLDYVASLATHLTDQPGRPQFVRVSEPAATHGTGQEASGAGSGYGPAFGSIPDFNEPPKGVRFADVRDGTPAAKAGLKAGDILVEFDGKEIGNLYDFTYALRAHKPGDLVMVKVLRGAQLIEANVLLTERR